MENLDNSEENTEESSKRQMTPLENERREFEIIKMMFENADIKGKIFNKLEPEFFQFGNYLDNKNNSDYMEHLKNYFDRFHRFPTFATFGNLIKREIPNLKKNHETLSQLNIGEVNSPDSVLSLELWMKDKLIRKYTNLIRMSAAEGKYENV